MIHWTLGSSQTLTSLADVLSIRLHSADTRAHLVRRSCTYSSVGLCGEAGPSILEQSASGPRTDNQTCYTAVSDSHWKMLFGHWHHSAVWTPPTTLPFQLHSRNALTLTYLVTWIVWKFVEIEYLNLQIDEFCRFFLSHFASGIGTEENNLHTQTWGIWPV